MKSPVKSLKTKNLDLERDLLLTKKDVEYMEKARFQKANNPDLGVYLDFLEEIGAFNNRKAETNIYPFDFEL